VAVSVAVLAVVRVDGSDGTSVTSALDSSGDRLAESASGGGFGWSLNDLHGDIIGSLTSSGAAIGDAFRYDPYGLAYGTGSASAWDAWRYGGRQVMSTGSNPDLYLMGARWYVPSLGVFSQFDTVAGSALDPLSLNRYLYTEADPLNLADPTGHCATRCIDYGESNAAANPGLDWAAISRRWAAEARARKAAIAFRARTARHVVETEAPGANVVNVTHLIAAAAGLTVTLRNGISETFSNQQLTNLESKASESNGLIVLGRNDAGAMEAATQLAEARGGIEWFKFDAATGAPAGTSEMALIQTMESNQVSFIFELKNFTPTLAFHAPAGATALNRSGTGAEIREVTSQVLDHPGLASRVAFVDNGVPVPAPWDEGGAAVWGTSEEISVALGRPVQPAAGVGEFSPVELQPGGGFEHER
jgi:RHS repeat-associated protein